MKNKIKVIYKSRYDWWTLDELIREFNALSSYDLAWIAWFIKHKKEKLC